MQACALSQRRSASAQVSTPWCRDVHSLVPKCLGAEVSWGRTVRTLRHQCRSVLVPKCLGSEVPVTSGLTPWTSRPDRFLSSEHLRFLFLVSSLFFFVWFRAAD